MSVSAVEGVTLRGDVARAVHRRGEETDRQVHRTSGRHDVVDASVKGSRLAEVNPPPVRRTREFAVNVIVSVKKGVPRAVLAGEESGGFVATPEIALVHLGLTALVPVISHRGATVRERHERHEALAVQTLLGRDFFTFHFGDTGIAVVAVRLTGRDRAHLVRESLVPVEPVLATTDAEAGEVELSLVVAEIPFVGIEFGAVELMRGIPVDLAERTPHPLPARVLREEIAVVRVPLLRIGSARPDASVGKLLERFDVLRAGRVFVRPGRRCTGQDRDKRHRTRIVIPVAAADVDAPVEILHAMDPA